MAFLIILSVFLALPISKVIWQLTPLPKLVQFPWRFLSLTTFALAVFVGRLPKKIGVIIATIVVLSAVPFLKIDRTFNSEGYYTTNDDSTTVQNEYNSKWLSVNITNKPDQEVVQLSPTKIRVYKMYFPGLEAYVDGVKTPIDYKTSGGLVDLTVSPGPHVVTTRFTETPLRLFADLLTILGILICTISLVRNIKEPKQI